MNTIIDTILLDKLTELAMSSDRMRMNYDLRNSDEDTSQRMLNAIEPGSIVPVHRHRKTSETVVVLRGSAVWEFYDEKRKACVGSYNVSSKGPIYALNIPIGQWHSLHSLESGTVIMEVKDGVYEPLKEIDILKL